MPINAAWNYDGIVILDNCKVTINGMTMIEGTASYKQTTLTWSAIDTTNGWEISIYSLNNRKTMWTGATRNLALEIAAAIKRH